MANITEVSQWENVIRQLENGEAATGGADGLANIQAKQLANRTKWLKGNLAPIVNAAFSGTLKHGNNDLAGSAIVAKSLGNIGYIKYASGLIIQFVHLHNITFNSEGIYTYTFPISFSTTPALTVTYTDSVSQMTTYNVDALEIFMEKVNLVARSGSNKIGGFSTAGSVSIIAIGI